MKKLDGFINTFKLAINEIWPMLTLFLVIFVLIRITYLIIKREKFYLYREVYYLISLVYTLILYHLLLGMENSALSGVNFVPFREITRYSFGSNLFIYNVIGNICVFIPFGLLLNSFLKTKKSVYSVLIAVIVSLTAELIQYKIGRAFDVDDVILNTLGAFLGCLVYKILMFITEHLPSFLKQTWFYNVICIIVMGACILCGLYIWGIF